MSENQPARRPHAAWLLAVATVAMPLVLALILSGCTAEGDKQDPTDSPTGVTGPEGPVKFLSMGTAPIGGTFPIVGDAIAQTLNAHKGSINWKVQAKGTKGSQANIRGLDSGTLELALSNSAISYFAVRGESDWDKSYSIRTVVTMAPNVAMFVTKSDSGIKSIADLKGKRVVVGPAGAGFEMFVGPILEEHGVTFDDFTKLNAPMGPAVDLLGDGDADAAFLGGAVPAAAISQAASSFDINFIPFDPAVRETLIKKYPFFNPAVVPADTYPGQEEDYAGLNVGSMHVITSASVDEDLVYQITKSIWENRTDIAAKHGAGKAINPKNAARYTGTDFHPGAIKFYTEAGIWPEAVGQAPPVETPADPPAADTPAEPAPETE